MHYLSAWAAYTGSVTEWIAGLLESGDITPADTVWQGPDGSYAVGELATAQEEAEYEEAGVELSDAGTVEEWLGEQP
jgi:hypothetical protein